MENQLNINDLLTNTTDGVEILPTLFAFVMCMVLAFVLRKFYQMRSFSLTGKSHIGAILPVLSAVVFIVIVVVKSSLALSLGLVGALSIVRFRTPIKEPEELVYLFMAIAIGLGFGAGHVLITTILITLTLIIIHYWLSSRDVQTKDYTIVINWEKDDLSFEKILSELKDKAAGLKLVRLDQSPGKNLAVLLFDPKENIDFDELLGIVRNLDEQSSLSFYEAETNW